MAQGRGILLTVVLVALAFGGGAVWQYRDARAFRIERDALEQKLLVQRLTSTLATAVIQADRASFDEARALTSDFFTTLQDGLDRMPEEATGALRDLLSRRDATITELSRGEPSSEETLTRMLVRYQIATGGPQVGIPVLPAQPMGTPAPAVDSGGAMPATAPAQP